MLGLNHHWYGHILASVLKYIVGVRKIDGKAKEIKISPYFAEGIKKISAKNVPIWQAE